MTTTTLTLTDFLLARIAEDEEVARGQDPHDASRPWAHYHHASRFNGPRIMAECEAKRRIVERHRFTSWRSEVLKFDVVTCKGCGHVDGEGPCPDLRLLALPYADHPDYREEWAL